MADVKETITENQKQLMEAYESLFSILEEIRIEGKEGQKELLSGIMGVEHRMSLLIESEMAEVSKLICEKNEFLQIMIGEEVVVLREKMENLHNQIANAQEQIKVLLSGMEEADVKRQEEIKALFSKVQTSLQ